MIQIDMLVYHARQLVTCASPNGPKRGAAMQDVGLLEDGAIAIADQKIVAVGPSSELLERFAPRFSLDATDKVVCPGFVDPHTHVVFAGDRVNEFEMRIKGASYMEIMEAGGGIISSARAVRAASVEQLVAETRPRLDAMLRLGTTTLEVKTGYGLDEASEMKLLAAIESLAGSHPCTLVPTFLGAHAIPAEYKTKPQQYVTLVIEKMLPQAAAWYAGSLFKERGIPFFCDVFCEKNAFSLEQSRRILETGITLGLGVKIHADEFTSLGGVKLAVELHAASVDHLDVTTPEERARLAQSDTIGVVLPAVNFNFGSAHFADARSLLDSGCALALSTDINPGSAPCPSLPLVMAIATRYQHLLPTEVLNASTINAAHAIGMGKRVGSLEPGKQADILILKTGDYRHLCYQFAEDLVQTVIKNGEIISA
ncbi:MAG: imidazolonepropionase [Chloroflexi bacterium]|nr:imidazolonepropionase [Chloroflexota bacterium]